MVLIYQRKPMLDKGFVFIYQNKPMLEKGTVVYLSKETCVRERDGFISSK